MKKTLLSLFIILLANISFANTQLKITGLKGIGPGAVCVKSLEGPQVAKYEMIKGNSVMLEFEMKADKQMLLVGVENEAYFLWFNKGDQIELNLTEMRVKGGDEKANSFLLSWYKQFMKDNNNLLLDNYRSDVIQYNDDSKCKLNPLDVNNAESVKVFKDEHKKELLFLKQSNQKDKEFKSYFEDLLNDFYYKRCNVTANKIRFYQTKVDKSILEEIFKIDLSKKDFLKSRYADEFLYAYIKARMDYTSAKSEFETYLYVTASTIPNKEVQEYYVLKEMNSMLSRKNYMFAKEIFASLSPMVYSTEGKNKYGELCRKLDEEMSKNKFDNVAAYSLKAFDVDGKQVSLEQFKGKFVYIDVWATWCGPCKQESPKFLKLASKFKGKDIVFITLSVDHSKDFNKWKKYVNEHYVDANCIPLCTKSGFNNDFVQHYRINAIPRFMLISKDGTMLYNNCWRPSDSRIEKLLERLLVK